MLAGSSNRAKSNLEMRSANRPLTYVQSCAKYLAKSFGSEASKMAGLIADRNSVHSTTY
jgi:hypothetical protein